MSPIPSLKVNKTLFDQLRHEFEKNPCSTARQQVADIMFRRAIISGWIIDGIECACKGNEDKIRTLTCGRKQEKQAKNGSLLP